MSEPYYQDEAVTLHAGDCLDVLRGMPDNSVDSVCTDPPYGLEFMGKDWDSFRVDRRQPGDDSFTTGTGAFGRATVRYGVGGSYGGDSAAAMRAFQAWCEEWSRECLRVLKPGGHMLAFGGTRTWHRLACAVEDTGVEMRDSIAWLYASGFPKSLDVQRSIDTSLCVLPGAHRWTERANMGPDEHVCPETPEGLLRAGHGTALKPAHEPIVVARKPLAGTVAANVTTWGTGALNIDACRVQMSEADRAVVDVRSGGSSKPYDVYSAGIGTPPGERFTSAPAGRWPSNLVLTHAATPDGHDLCADRCVEGCPVRELDQQSGVQRDGVAVNRNRTEDDRTSWYGTRRSQTGADVGYGGSGGASRFFPTFRYEPKAPTTERPRDGAVAHPTVKPLDLIRWLTRLVTPPGGLVLDPFAGSGTTAEACILNGFRCTTIEREPAYLPLIVARLTKPLQPDLFGGGAA
jgi:DNA modification methylase